MDRLFLCLSSLPGNREDDELLCREKKRAKSVVKHVSQSQAFSNVSESYPHWKALPLISGLTSVDIVDSGLIFCCQRT